MFIALRHANMLNKTQSKEKGESIAVHLTSDLILSYFEHEAKL